MSDTTTVPNDEQLKEYAAQLPDLYKDILAAYQFVNDSRHRGEGVFESTLKTFLRDLAFVKPSDLNWILKSGPVGRHPYKFSLAFDEYNDDAFSTAIDRLIEHGFIEPRDPTGLGSLIPTKVGERLIEIVAGRPAPEKQIPDLPKPMWR